MKASLKKLLWIIILIIMGVSGYQYNESTGHFENQPRQEESQSNQQEQAQKQGDRTHSDQAQQDQAASADSKTAQQDPNPNQGQSGSEKSSSANKNQSKPADKQGQKSSRQKDIPPQESSLDPNQYYYTKEEVMAFIHQFDRLPDNYIIKSQANQQGWSTRDKTYVVGGNRFGNREGRLPKKKGRQYYEADVQAGYSHHRGPERIIYSNDGLIFYTDDHYDSFQQYY